VKHAHRQAGFLVWCFNLTEIKVAVKQDFDNVDAIIFEAALTLNAAETQYKQMEYVS